MSKQPMLVFAPHEPTQAQQESGNYAKKRIRWQGIDIAIENPAGSVRRGTSRDGCSWESRMVFDYGYLNRTEGVDGDHVDCFVGPNPDAPFVYIVHARKYGAWDQYDEDKCMIGFDSEGDARAAFLASYSDPRFLGPITVLTVDDFKAKAKATLKNPAMIKSLLLFKARGWWGPERGGTHIKHSPIGTEAPNGSPHEPTVEENLSLGRRSMGKVIREKTDIRHAMYRPDHGWVSFYWGQEGNPTRGFAGGKGIAKIIAKRTSEGSNGLEVASKMVEVIALGVAGDVYGPPGGERFNVKYDGHTAVLSLRHFDEEDTWLLTGWDDIESGGAEAVNASGTYTTDPSGIQDRSGADEKIIAKCQIMSSQNNASRLLLLVKSTTPETPSELIKEHQRLVAVLRSPSHEDDLEEADKQEDELEEYETMAKAEYQGKEVTLNKPFRTSGGPKKFAVYVKNSEGNVVIVRFGDPNMEIKRDDPERRKNFRARHNCSEAKDPTTPAYWSCRMWSKEPVSDLAKSVTRERADSALNYRLQMIAAELGPLSAQAVYDASARSRLNALVQERYTLMVALGDVSI